MTRRNRGSFAVGVIIAVVLLLVVGGVAAWLFWPNIPKPSGKFDARPIEVKAELSSIIEMPSGEAGDGAEDVHAAVQRYQDLQEQIERKRQSDLDAASVENLDMQLLAFWQDGDKVGLLPFDGSKELLAAADKAEFNYYEKYVDPETLEWRQPSGRLGAIEWTGKSAIMKAEREIKRGRDSEGEKILRAALIYGHRLANATHVRVWTQKAGLSIQVAAAQSLAGLYSKQKDVEKFNATREYFQAASAALNLYEKTFGGLCQKVNKWNPGDLLLVAEKHPDRAWKVEALLALGMSRHTHGTQKYEKHVQKQLTRYAGSDDKWIAAAANWSRELTLADYNTQSAESDY